MEIADLFFWLLLVGMVATVVIIIVRGSLGGGGGAGMTAVTAFHDLSPSDKQRAIEIVVEAKAGKKWMEQESGKGKPEEKSPAHTGEEPGPDAEASRGTRPGESV